VVIALSGYFLELRPWLVVCGLMGLALGGPSFALYMLLCCAGLLVISRVMLGVEA